MNIVDIFNMFLDYSKDPRYPKITDIRNVRKVSSSERAVGYSFIFEACVDGKYISYGPHVNGNWTVQSGQKDHLPILGCYGKYTSDTIPIGFHTLDKAFGNLPLEES